MACCGGGRKAQRQLHDFAVGEPPALADFNNHDGKLDERLYERLSTFVRPTFVERDNTASVNTDNHTSSHASPSLRRMSTARAGLLDTQPLTSVPGARLCCKSTQVLSS